MSSQFKGWFYKSQMITGTAIRMAAEGYIDSGITGLLLWAIGGFFVVLPLTAGYSLVRVAVYRRKMRRLGLEPARLESS